MGDFDGKIADLPDYLDLNDKKLDFQSNILSDFRYRYNKEHNDAGKQVLDVCKSFNLRILNERKLVDMRSDFTHYNNVGGQSTVDLGIVSDNFFQPHRKIYDFSTDRIIRSL